MKPLFVYLTLLLLSVSLTCEAQRNRLTEIKSNTSQRDFKKILIVGSGSVEARALLEILTENIISLLKNKNITAEFYYKGKDTIRANKEIKQLLTNDFDAVIYFSPIDSSQYSQTKYVNTTSRISQLGNPTSNTYSRTVKYEESFDIQLIENKHSGDSIWAAILDVDCTVNKKTKIKALAIKIFNSLEKNKLVK